MGALKNKQRLDTVKPPVTHSKTSAKKKKAMRNDGAEQEEHPYTAGLLLGRDLLT